NAQGGDANASNNAQVGQVNQSSGSGDSWGGGKFCCHQNSGSEQENEPTVKSVDGWKPPFGGSEAEAQGGNTSASSGNATGGNGGNANAQGGNANASNGAQVWQQNSASGGSGSEQENESTID